MMDTTTSTHRQAWDLIPWVVGGSASEDECALVHRHLSSCADCRDEYEFQRTVCEAMAHEAQPPRSAEPALQQLLARLDAAEAPVPAQPLERPAAERARMTATRWLAAAVVVQAVGLAAMAGMLWERPSAAEYQTLSRTAAPPVPASIRLVPAPTLSLADLRSLLAKSNLQIVDASGDGGILGLAPRPLAEAVNVDEQLAWLRAQPGVLLAEPSDEAALSRAAPK